MSGSFPEFDYASTSTIPGANAQPSFSNSFGSPPAVGAQSAVYDGIGTVPPTSSSANGSLIITGGSSTVTPDGYSAVYDLSGADTVNGESDSLAAYLQNNTVFMAGSGSDTIYAGGADTINAGSGATSVYGGAAGATVQGGAGTLQFVGGSGSVSVQGGRGNTTLFGGNGASPSYLVGGSGNNTLLGGSGSGPSTLSGGIGSGSANDVMFGNGSGPTVFQTPQQGAALINGTTGSGQELMVGSAMGGSTVALNNAADTVISGAETNVLGGAGPDLYGISPTDGGSANIYGFKSGDQIAILGGFGVSQEAVLNGSDTIITGTGVVVTLVGVDHTIFT